MSVLDNDGRPVDLEEGLQVLVEWPDRVLTYCTVHALGEAWAISTFLHGMPARVPVDILADRGVKVSAS